MTIPINYSYICHKPLLSHLKINLAILGAPSCRIFLMAQLSYVKLKESEAVASFLAVSTLEVLNHAPEILNHTPGRAPMVSAFT